MNRIIVLTVILYVGNNCFLYDQTTPGTTGQESKMTDKHYIYVMDMLVQEKQLRERYMTQLQNKVVQNENKTDLLESRINQIMAPLDNSNKDNPELTALKNLVAVLVQNYHKIEREHEDLQKRYVMLQNNVSAIIANYRSLSNKLGSVENGLKNLQDHQFSNDEQIQNESLKLTQHIDDANRRLDSLNLKQSTSRLKLLELNNTTKDVQSNITEIKTKIVESNLHFQSVDRKYSQLANNQDAITNRLQQEMKQVAFTSCSLSTTVQPGHPMKFPVIVTSNGVRLSAFQSSGIFSCEIGGLYLVSLTVMSSTPDSFFQIYKNSEYLLDAYIVSSSDYYHSGTANVVVNLDISDAIYVKPVTASVIFYEPSRIYTCITIVKIK